MATRLISEHARRKLQRYLGSHDCDTSRKNQSCVAMRQDIEKMAFLYYDDSLRNRISVTLLGGL